MAHLVLIAAIAALASSVAGCASTPAAKPERTMGRAPIVPAQLPDADWAEVDSPRFFLSFPLPDARSWRVDDTTGRWLQAVHAPSTSMLFVRSWRDGGLVRRAACEEQARRWRPEVFGRTADAQGERRPATAPAGFESEVAVRVNRSGDAWVGVLVLTAANVRRCLAVGFVTRVKGSGAEAELGSRLALIEEGVLSRVMHRSIDDRAREGLRPRAPLDPVDGR